MVDSTLVRAHNIAILSKQGESVVVYDPTITTDATDFYTTASSLGSGTTVTAYLKDIGQYEIINSQGKLTKGDCVGYFSYTAGLKKDYLVKSVSRGRIYSVRDILADRVTQGSIIWTKADLKYIRDV